MLQSDKHSFCWFHAPRTGGSSVAASLAPHLNNPRKPRPDGTNGWQFDHHIDRKMHSRMRDCVVPENYTTIMVVRNPYERVWSMFHTYANPGMGNLEEFIQKCIVGRDGPHQWMNQPCSAFARAADLDVIGRFENLENDFARITDAVIGTPIQLEHRNVNQRVKHYDREDWRHAYTEGARRMVEDHYAQDFDDFGYELL